MVVRNPTIALMFLPKLVECVQCGDLVAFRQGRVVESGGQNILESAPQPQHSLADMDQLCRTGADCVNSQETMVLSVKQHFEESAIVTHDVATRNLSIESDTALVGNLPRRQHVLRLSNSRQFRDRVDT